MFGRYVVEKHGLIKLINEGISLHISGRHLQSEVFSRHVKCARSRGNKSSHIYGDICCDPVLEEVLGSVHQHHDESLGDTAKKLYKVAFEVVMSAEDFVVASYSRGSKVCKISFDGLYVLAYRTPAKYNVGNQEKELWFSGVDSQERLGSTLDIDREDWRDIRTDPLANLNTGTHCIPAKRSGNKCCSLDMYNIMATSIDEVATSTIHNISSQTLGVIVNMLRKRMPQRFGRVFEFFASKKDFAQATYSVGRLFCKIKKKDIYIAAYETPKQAKYDPYDQSEEGEYAALSDADPLGTDLPSLPGQITSRGVPLETSGYRIGFPKDSHCDHSRRDGMKCCHMDLFSAMYNMIEDLGDSFGSLNQRHLATKLRHAAEDAISEPLELIISASSIVVAGQNNSSNCTCHFKADQYHIMAWRTPGDYEIGIDMFADNGKTLAPTCRAKDGKCCSPQVHFDIVEQLNKIDGRRDLGQLSKELTQKIQGKYNSRFETVVGMGAFNYRPSPGRGYYQVDYSQYSVVMFEIGGTPLPGEFETADVQDSFSTAVTVLGDGGNPSIGQGTVNEAHGESDAENEPNPTNENSNDSQNQNQNQDSQPIQQSQGQVSPQNALQAPAPLIMPMLFQGAPGNLQNIIAAAAGNQGAGLGAGGAACFSEDMLVVTPLGARKMGDLQIGDRVLTSGERGPYFSPVHAWLHREPQSIAVFIKVKTACGKVLLLTPRHLLYRKKCEGNTETFSELDPPTGGAVFAEDIRIDDCLYIYEEGKYGLAFVVEVNTLVKKGIYAPLTRNGKIFVNGILASCYSEFQFNDLLDTYITVKSVIHDLLRGWKFDPDEGKLPPYFNILEDLIHFFIPRK